MKKTAENRQNTASMNINSRYKSAISGQPIDHDAWRTCNGITKASIPSQPIIAAYNSELNIPRIDRLPAILTSAMCAAKNADAVTTWLTLRVDVADSTDTRALQLALRYAYNATIARDKRGNIRIVFAPRCNLSGIAKAIRYIASYNGITISGIYANAKTPEMLDGVEVESLNDCAALEEIFVKRFGYTFKPDKNGKGISASAIFENDRQTLATLSALNALATTLAKGKTADKASAEALKQYGYTLKRGNKASA